MNLKSAEMQPEGNCNFLKDQKILIIEDDPDTQVLLWHIFSGVGGEVIPAQNGFTGMQKFHNESVDLIILDIMMPDLNGYEVCARIRKKSNIPIIMLTVLDQENDIIHGLDAGANDFLSKPISRSLLLSRSRAVLRSSLRFHVTNMDTIDYSDGYLTIMLAMRRVWAYGKPVHLTPREFDMLGYLVKNSGHRITNYEILTYAWGWNDRDCVEEDVHSSFVSLQRKIEPDPKHPVYLISKDGEGHSFLSPSLAWQPGINK
jgi:DNA-binding response OmpR family regulator